VIQLSCGWAQAAIDIGPMSWTPRADWINVKNPSALPALAGYKSAIGDGVADDTAAIQAIFKYIEKKQQWGVPHGLFSPGHLQDHANNHFLSHAQRLVDRLRQRYEDFVGRSGWRRHVLAAGVDNMRYVGLTWLGNNHAAVAYEECSYQVYSGGLRHENESFHDFTAKATYVIRTRRAADHHADAPNGRHPQRLSRRPDGRNTDLQLCLH